MVSIQSLILVQVQFALHFRQKIQKESQTRTDAPFFVSHPQHPYFNEPGYEGNYGTPDGMYASKEYNDALLPATVAFAMRDHILNPTPVFKDVIMTHFYLKREEILEQMARWKREIGNSHRAKLEAEITKLEAALQNLEKPSRLQ